MIIDDQHYDLIIVGTGAGGGTLLHKLAPTGKKILVLERGNFLPKENENWNAVEVFGKGRYNAQEQWYDISGEPFRPQTNYWVGGNTKVYGAALLRCGKRILRRFNIKMAPLQNGLSNTRNLNRTTPKQKSFTLSTVNKETTQQNLLAAKITLVLRKPRTPNAATLRCYL
jgi:choline dehydrogenase-like flavoprotein